LPVGTVRLKYGGGNGGHNGLRSIEQHLGTPQFNRLRIGIGRPVGHQSVVDYVLSVPSLDDKITIGHALDSAKEVLPLLVQGEFEKAMTQLHTEK
ncbi:MAG TPA: aminoacyl-tRNA hydrolase, partial [Gammaproteobacteria bacterium]|nr:aminoacyl-tRNA hydrolase [Gammaproteobacteria bacterium]